MQMVDVTFERDGTTAVAIVTGEIDMSNAASVRQQIAGYVTSDDDALIVDLSRLSFIDSAGLHGLIELGTVLREKRQRLLLCVSPGSSISRAIEIVGLSRNTAVHPDREAAMEAARASTAERRPFPPGEEG